MKQVLMALLLGIAALTFHAGAAAALEASPSPITAALTDDLREPFARFLREMGVKDTAAIMNSTKVYSTEGPFRKSTFFRIENQSNCINKRCLAIVGRVLSNELQVDAMFVAGKYVGVPDGVNTVLGVRNLSMRFSDNQTVEDRYAVYLLETPKGWLVVPPFPPAKAPQQ